MDNETVNKGSDVAIGILFVSILTVVLLLAAVITFGAVNSADISSNGYKVVNGINVNEAYTPSDNGQHLAVFDKLGASCTIIQAYNNTIAGVIINPGNYTQSPTCNLRNLTSEFTTVGWKVNYSYSWNNVSIYNSGTKEIQANLVSMIINFFAMMPTVGTILAVVILIAAIVLLVIYVQRMKNSGSQGDQVFAG